MDADDLLSSKPLDPLIALAREDLDSLSAAELDARIAALEAEIERTRARMAFARSHRASAEDLFRAR